MTEPYNHSHPMYKIYTVKSKPYHVDMALLTYEHLVVGATSLHPRPNSCNAQDTQHTLSTLDAPRHLMSTRLAEHDVSAIGDMNPYLMIESYSHRCPTRTSTQPSLNTPSTQRSTQLLCTYILYVKLSPVIRSYSSTDHGDSIPTAAFPE